MNNLPANANHVVVRGGRIQELEAWVLRNDRATLTIMISRDPDYGFISCIGDSDRGWRGRRGSIEEVLKPLDESS